MKKITKEDYIDTIEIYARYYKCKECTGGVELIFNYCPWCGCKLIFDDELKGINGATYE